MGIFRVTQRRKKTFFNCQKSGVERTILKIFCGLDLRNVRIRYNRAEVGNFKSEKKLDYVWVEVTRVYSRPHTDEVVLNVSSSTTYYSLIPTSDQPITLINIS